MFAFSFSKIVQAPSVCHDLKQASKHNFFLRLQTLNGDAQQTSLIHIHSYSADQVSRTISIKQGQIDVQVYQNNIDIYASEAAVGKLINLWPSGKVWLGH